MRNSETARSRARFCFVKVLHGTATVKERSDNVRNLRRTTLVHADRKNSRDQRLPDLSSHRDHLLVHTSELRVSNLHPKRGASLHALVRSLSSVGYVLANSAIGKRPRRGSRHL